MTKYYLKPVSIILTFLLIISVVTIIPVSASAVTDESLFGFENGTITSYSGSDTVVVIPSTINGISVTNIGSLAFSPYNSSTNSNVTSVTIPDSVGSIDELAFHSCTSLTNVTIGSHVENIGNSAFYGCTSLTSVEIPDSVTRIRNEAFSYCTALESIIIGSGVTRIGDEAFNACYALTRVEIPESVEYIGEYAFYYCSSLSAVIFFSSETVIEEEYCFYNENNTSLTLYGAEGSTAEAFVNNVKSEDLYPINFQIYSDTPQSEYEYDINGTNATITAYNGTDTEVDIPSQIDGYTVTAIGSLSFSGKTSLTSVSIPNTVTTIGNNAFSGCTSLMSIDIPNSVTTIEYYAFGGCAGLTELVIPDSVTTLGNSFCSGTSVANLTIGNGVTNIANYCFAGMSTLKNVKVGNSVTSIGDGAFAGCSNLTTAIIPRSVTNMGSGVFISSSNLTIYGYDGSYAEEYAESNNIPFITMFNTNKGDGYEDDVLTGTQTRDGADASFGINKNSYQNFELLGVQRKIDRGSTDMRFVAVINDGIINDESVADYGFVVAKTDYTTTAQATDRFISKVTLGAANTVKRSCKGTVNSFSGIYGRIDTATKYKYLTLAIENVPDNQGFVVRFYLKTKSGKVFYANYITDYTGCVTSYANLNSLVA